MNIRNRREIRQTASHSISTATGNIRQVALIYGGILCGLSLISTLISYYLNTEIAATGGLSNMGLRSILTTIKAILPFLQVGAALGLELGYTNAMLRTARGLRGEASELLHGFRRFLPMAVASFWKVLIYTGVMIAAIYISSWIFMFLPAYDAFMVAAEPLLQSMTTLSAGYVMDEVTMYAIAETMIPLLYILAVVAPAMLLPFVYKYRMLTFCLVDSDQYISGMRALRESRKMMRGNRWALFRLDLGFWWFYLAQVVVSIVCYGDMLLPLLGVELPWSGVASYFIFLIVSLFLQLAIYVYMLNRVTVTYATAYDAIRPKPAQGVPLGNIFNL